MKKNYYTTYVAVNENSYMYYNSFENCYLLLNSNKHKIYQNNSPTEIESQDPKFYNELIENKFIIEDFVDEYKIVEFKKISKKLDSNLYHVVINTTLDCNLNCWYCYEKKETNTQLSNEVIAAIKKNIEYKYKEQPFKTLKVSFFGGEPLANFPAIEEILIYSKEFSLLNNICLIADFTTNSTLLTNEQINFLKDFNCYFQITLDGYENKHNKVRFLKNTKEGTYRTIIENLYKIQSEIENSWIWVRVNYDNKTLDDFSKILKDISGLDRNKTYMIIRKIWQVEPTMINKTPVLNALQMAIDEGFFIDNFAMPRTSLCFAERLNQVLFNYDGKVFKCSTLDHFGDDNAEGTMDLETGEVNWNISKIANKIIQETPQKCIECKIYPACLGPCGQTLQQGKGFKCIIDSVGLTMEQFVMYNFKLKVLRLKLNV